VTRSPAERLRAPAPSWRLVASGTSARDVWRFRPLVVLRLAIVLMLVAQLGRIPVLSTGTSEAPLLVNDLCVMAVLAAGMFSGLVSRSFRLDRIGGIALIFASVGALSAFLAIPRFGLDAYELLVSLAYLARWVVYLGVYVVMVNVVRADDVTSVWRTLEWTILAFAAFGIIQSIFIPHFAQVVYPDSRVFIDWDEQGHRLVSTVLEPNIAGAMIMVVLLVQLAQLAANERVPLWKPFLLFAALVATLSRSSFLGLLIGCGLILAVRGVSRRLMRMGMLLGVVAIAALPKLVEYGRAYGKLTVDASAMSRVGSWLKALRVFADNPIIGVGFNTYGYVQEVYGYTRLGLSTNSTDGGLLFIAVMTGVVGLTLYLTMLALVLRRCRRVWRDAALPREHRALATGVGAATVAVCVHSVFVNSLLTPFVMEPLWVLWALVSILAWTIVPRVPRRARVRLVATPSRS
jgi:hypothetical protein